MNREHEDAGQTPPNPRNRDEAITPDEDIKDVNLDNDDDDNDNELSSAYERGYRAGERDACEGGESDNPYSADAILADHELWQDGYNAGKQQ